MKIRLETNDTGWWYWLASWVLILAGLGGWTAGFYLVTGLASVQIGHYAAREKSLRAFSVQVRIAFFVLMMAGLFPPLRFLYWLPAAGLAARLFVNYCFLARALSLLPWNLKTPLTQDLIRRKFLTPPVDGSVLDIR
jgi:hypothetical protein